VGRFIQADTIVPSPGNPQHFNRYSYVLNNPLGFVDPTGYFTEDEIMDFFGVDTWDKALALFASGSEHDNPLYHRWGFLEILRQAMVGDDFYVSDALDDDIFSEMNLIGQFAEVKGGRIKFFREFRDDAIHSYSEAFLSGEDVATLLGSAQRFGLRGGRTSSNFFSLSWDANWQFATGAFERHDQIRFDISRVDAVDAGLDTVGISTNFLVLTFSGVTGDSLPSKQRSGDCAASCCDRRIH
jgi:hypothetical protein